LTAIGLTGGAGAQVSAPIPVGPLVGPGATTATVQADQALPAPSSAAPAKAAPLAAPLAANAAAKPAQTVVIHTAAKGAPFPHFWEQMFGSGRAILSLRDSYRADVRTVKAATGVQYLRFHDILDDDVGLVRAGPKGAITYNFSWVDEIYDGLLDNGVRPYVELSFMPSALAASSAQHAFWYKPLPDPPRSYEQWGELVRVFTQHMVDRYGLPEVNQWYFEVWNEPNLDFWTGRPAQSTYFQLYDAAAKAIKSVSPSIRVGGPATAQAAWIPEFIKHCYDGKVPVDFVSTHVYGNDPQFVLGPNAPVGNMEDMVSLAVKKVYREVGQSPLPHLPIIWSEFNASASNDPAVTDSAFMGPWLADTIRQCDGFATMMSYWDFSDVFDEQGVTTRPFYGGYGLIAEGHIPKASFNAFAMFHRLGAERIPAPAPWVLATRRTDGSLALAVWNYAPPQATAFATTSAQNFEIDFSGWKGARSARVQYLDADRGSALGAWEKMGAPPYPSFAQVKALKAAARLPEPTLVPLQNDALTLTLPVHGLALVELSSGPGS
jgi:xylan 1,4-beta-xylosidase